MLMHLQQRHPMLGQGWNSDKKLRELSLCFTGGARHLPFRLTLWSFCMPLDFKVLTFDVVGTLIGAVDGLP
jgi:hypothetical protein